MQVIESVAEICATLQGIRASGKSIGFIPTMGALHEGHLKLVERSTDENDATVCSVFVNPIQFNNQNDLDKYPRTLDKDLLTLSSTKCDYIFYPSYSEMYPDGVPEPFQLGELANVMEGSFRPGHFDGVTTVVKRFFDILGPSRAYFGLKDYQQYAVIKFMSKALAIPVDIIGCKTFRSSEGLALSSRNQLLDKRGMDDALLFIKSLQLAKSMHESSTVEEIKNAVSMLFEEKDNCRLEYFELADGEHLKPVRNLKNNSSIVAFIAGYVGNVRLIDNLILIP